MANAARAFYVSLFDEKPDSKVALKYVVEHAIPHRLTCEVLFERYLNMMQEEDSNFIQKQMNKFAWSKGRFHTCREKQQQLRQLELSGSIEKAAKTPGFDSNTIERVPPTSEVANTTSTKFSDSDFQSVFEQATWSAPQHELNEQLSAVGDVALKRAQATILVAIAAGTASAAPTTPQEDDVIISSC